MKRSQVQIQEAVKILKQGGVVVYPTFTSYGLAADATNIKAVKRLYALKGRHYNIPVHVIARDTKQAATLVKFNPSARQLTKIFWPGPLTLVLPLRKSGKSWRMLSAGTKTLGVRVPDHPIVVELLNAFGGPITATSANISGKPNAYSIGEAKKQFERAKFKPNYYLDAGRLPKIKPSTIIQIDGRHVTLLREGPIGFHRLINFLK